MSNEIVVKIESEILQDTKLGIYGLQETLQNKIVNLGLPVAEVVENFRKEMGVLNDLDVVDRDVDGFIDALNNDDHTHYYMVLREAATVGLTENIPQHAENLLKAVQKQYLEDQKLQHMDRVMNYPKVSNVESKGMEKSFEQQMDDTPEIPYDQMAFVNHMHHSVDNEIDDMDEYHKVMNTLWKIFCVGGWSQVDAGYLECVDRFRDNYESKCDTSLLKIGSSVRLMNGETQIVENFMWMEPDDLYNKAYSLAIKFQGFNRSVIYTEKGWYNTDEKYNLLNMVSIDGKA